MNRSLLFVLLLGSTVLMPILMLGGCSALSKGEAKYPTGTDRSGTGGTDIYSEAPSIFGEGGLDMFSKSKDSNTGVTVNAYLWRAALDTVSFMPLASADPFGGTIITDWYTEPSTPNERTKLNVLILGKELKSDALKAKIFRQVKAGNGWKDASVAPDTAIKLEDAILVRAREMRVAKD